MKFGQKLTAECEMNVKTERVFKFVEEVFKKFNERTSAGEAPD